MGRDVISAWTTQGRPRLEVPAIRCYLSGLRGEKRMGVSHFVLPCSSQRVVWRPQESKYLVPGQVLPLEGMAQFSWCTLELIFRCPWKGQNLKIPIQLQPVAHRGTQLLVISGLAHKVGAGLLLGYLTNKCWHFLSCPHSIVLDWMHPVPLTHAHNFSYKLDIT